MAREHQGKVLALGEKANEWRYPLRFFEESAARRRLQEQGGKESLEVAENSIRLGRRCDLLQNGRGDPPDTPTLRGPDLFRRENPADALEETQRFFGSARSRTTDQGRERVFRKRIQQGIRIGTFEGRLR